MAFDGLDAQAFATYSQEKWSSMVHNLARMKVKDAMVALCDRATGSLDDELAGLVRAASDEIPNITNHKKVDAQWVYWFRGPEERAKLASFLKRTPLDQATIFNIAAQDKHATLAVVIRHDGLWIGLRIASGAVVDRNNLASKLGKSWERERLVELLAELPEGAAVGTQEERAPTGDITLAQLDTYGELLASDGPSWLLGHHIPAAQATELGSELADHVGRWLGLLAPLYRFAAWSRDNDFIEANKQIQEEKAQKRRQATSYREGDKVRVVGGLFSGKIGVVESIDTKAQVKIRVGKMSVVVSGHDLLPT